MALNPDEEATVRSWAYTEALKAAELVYKQHEKERPMSEIPGGNIESEPEEETGVNKAWMTNLKNVTDAWIANMKRSYDEYQDLGLTGARNARTHFDKVVSDAQQADNARQNVALQALQNAVETANMVGKQAVRHGDIAIDGQWNPIESGAGNTLTARAVTLDDVALKSIGAVVAAAVAEALTKKA